MLDMIRKDKSTDNKKYENEKQGRFIRKTRNHKG